MAKMIAMEVIERQYEYISAQPPANMTIPERMRWYTEFGKRGWELIGEDDGQHCFMRVKPRVEMVEEATLGSQTMAAAPGITRPDGTVLVKATTLPTLQE
jgi:hypothetical protein